MQFSDLALAFQLYRQEYNQTHQRVLRWTQAVMMIFVLTLSLTSEGIQKYLSSNLENLLGADVVISQNRVMESAELNALNQFAEQITLTQQVLTTINHRDVWQQTKLKGVANGYPLQGKLRTSKESLTGSEGVIGEDTEHGPQRGEIWLDSRLFNTLQVEIGTVLKIANNEFVVSRLLLHEPDRLMEGHTVEMRAMVHLDDLAALNFSSDLIQHRYLVAADKSNLTSILEWQKQSLPAATVFYKGGAHPLALFWQRTENVLGLASVILFFMAAIAIEQLSHVHIRKEKYFSAICMSLGVNKSRAIKISIVKWCLSVLVVLPFVLVVSSLLNYLLLQWLAETFSGLYWAFDLGEYSVPITLVIAVLLVFQLPVWLATISSSVAQLIRTESANKYTGLTKLSGVAVLCLIAVYYSDNGLLTAMIMGSIAIAIAVIVLMSWVGLTLLEKSSQRFSGLMPFTLYMMKQRLVNKSTQILGVGLCAFLLLFTLMLMKDLGRTAEAHQRHHNGNLLVSQASSEQMQFIENWAMENKVNVIHTKPYVYAKLLHINEQTVSEFQTTPSDSLATMSRSIRMHWSQEIPSNNRVVAGQWWQQGDNNWQQISVEQEVMTDLGLELGDRLTFYIGQQQVEFTIAATHVYRSGGGSITFWVQMPPSARAFIDTPEYAMASIEIDQHQWSLLGQLWQRFPTLRMVSLNEMTARFDAMLKMVTQVISGFSFVIVLLASLVVVATVHALKNKEMKKNSIIMSFGFDRQTCLKLNMLEWAVTGFLAAFGAIVGTYIAGLLIYQSQFSLTYQPNWWWMCSTLAIILGFVMALGMASSKQSLNTSIRNLLAEG